MGQQDRASEGIIETVLSPVENAKSSSPGLRWIVMAVVVSLPWTRATLGLAFLVRDFRRLAARQ